MAAKPIQVVPLHGGELAAPAKAPHLTYRGGPVLSSAQVTSVFWGPAWDEGPLPALAQQLNDFFDYILTSPLLDQLGEYSVPGMTIGHGALVGRQAITSTPPHTVSDSDIQQLLLKEFPSPPPESLHFLFLPPGTMVKLDGGASCSNFCGYHSDVRGGLFYAVMPYPDCSGCVGGLPVLDALTSTCSHELCEAITDPVPGQGWYDDANGEIGDICAWRTKQLGAYTVQLEWSNSAGDCI
ncbi:MAG: hypothetical protein ABI334_08140 [Candidatus Dormiibacterota bacterium]